MSKRRHFLAAFLTALGTNLSAFWILVANGWMQNPVGSKFNYRTFESRECYRRPHWELSMPCGTGLSILRKPGKHDPR